MTSHHPKDEEFGYCGKCHNFTGQQAAQDEITKLMRLVMDKDEEDRADLMLSFAIEAVQNFRAKFDSSTDGMMTMMLAIHVIMQEFPGLAEKSPRAPELVKQWILAGRPETPSEVPAALFARYMRGKMVQ
jgi:hypothetical protein